MDRQEYGTVVTSQYRGTGVTDNVTDGIYILYACIRHYLPFCFVLKIVLM